MNGKRVVLGGWGYQIQMKLVKQLAEQAYLLCYTKYTYQVACSLEVPIKFVVCDTVKMHSLNFGFLIQGLYILFVSNLLYFRYTWLFPQGALRD